MKRDIFWIVTDEHRVDGIGAYGNHWIKTPNLDRLASNGVLFERAYCQSPACVASRASFLSGMYPSTTENMWFDPTRSSLKFFPEILQENGYHTVNVGKEHHNRERSPFNESFLKDGPKEGWPGSLSAEFIKREKELNILKRKSTFKKLIVGGTNPLPANEAECANRVHRSIQYLENYQQNPSPILFRLSLLYPHTPVIPPEPFDTLYDASLMEYPSDSVKSKGVIDFEKKVYQQISGTKGMTRSEIMHMRKSYYGLCSYVDEEIGNFINYLENNWQRPYLIVFHSDHGNLLGEHDLNEKFNMYEPSRQVPLIIQGHNIPRGKRIKPFTELVDIAPTLLEYTGIKSVEKMEGKSLIPLMNHPSIRWRDYAFTEHRIFTPHDLFQHPALQDYVLTEIEGKRGYDVVSLAKIIEDQNLDWYKLEGTPYKWWGPIFQCIRTDRYAMNVRPIWKEGQGKDFMGTLYDLEIDPHETNNLFKSKKYETIKNQMLLLLKNHFKQNSTGDRK